MKMNCPRPINVARRALVLRAVATHAFAAGPRGMADEGGARHLKDQAQDYWRSFKRSGLWRYLTRTERAFTKTEPIRMSQQDQANFQWRIEAFQVLLWSLNELASLPPLHQEPDPLMLSSDRSYFLQGPVLRPVEMIDSMRDSIKLWHWRSRPDNSRRATIHFRGQTRFRVQSSSHPLTT